MELITDRYRNQTAGMLTCFDRVVLSGNLDGYCYAKGMAGYLYEKGIRFFDYQAKVAKPLADELKAGAIELAKSNGIAIQYLGKSKVRKESVVEGILAERGAHPGLVAIISCVEGCKRFAPWYEKKSERSSLETRSGQCLHYYFYFIDELLGLCYLRVPTWLPCRLQFYFNGHNYLANRLSREKIGFTMADNCFTSIDSFETANQLAAELNPAEVEERLRHHVSTLIPAVERAFDCKYRWTIMQLELSTDIVFKDESILPGIYQQLISSAVHTVKVPDVASFLGLGMPRTNLDNRGNSLKSTIEGVRLKHNYGKHSIKMYDKFNLVLRLETTTNQLNLFRTRRLVTHEDGSTSMCNAPIPKSLRSLPMALEVMGAANRRYLEYISTIEDFSVGRGNLKKVSAPVVEKNRKYQGINFFNEVDGELLLAVFSGAFNIAGFRNNDIKRLFGGKTGTVSRALKRLRVHGLIKRIGKTYKYYLTALGREVIAAGMKLKELYVIPRLNFINP